MEAEGELDCQHFRLTAINSELIAVFHQDAVLQHLLQSALYSAYQEKGIDAIFLRRFFAVN